MAATQRTTRLAPSPTGALHLGNARTFLINWALARQCGWRITLRIDDLDSPRVKPGADRGAIDDLRWLGVDWDDGPSYQTDNMPAYAEALERLRRGDLVYPCRCSRREIAEAQSAPHGDGRELRYPGTCRPVGQTPGFRQGSALQDNGDLPAGEPAAWRLAAPDETVEFVDCLHGRQAVNVQQEVGDFIVATKAGLPAYQLAVVVDDERQGVTDIVRGNDLLSSTCRQILLSRMMGLGCPRQYWHVPLVLGEDGKRLAKRHGDTRLAWYRSRGVAAKRVIGLLAYWCGMVAARRETDAGEFRRRLAIDNVARGDITFSAEDHAWLLQK